MLKFNIFIYFTKFIILGKRKCPSKAETNYFIGNSDRNKKQSELLVTTLINSKKGKIPAKFFYTPSLYPPLFFNT